jgi:3-phenylpropionate/trans-cinnamate dioxygenase ferredoxin reductase component
MCGDTAEYDAVPWFWSDQFDLGLQVAGLPAEADVEVVRNRPDGAQIRFGLDATGRVIAASAVGVGNAVAKDIRLAEKAIAKRATPTTSDLTDTSVNLKQLLR